MISGFAFMEFYTSFSKMSNNIKTSIKNKK